jgi:hypothetical protein
VHMKALFAEIWVALAMGLLAWAGVALLTNESIIDDWLVAIASNAADQRLDSGAGTTKAASVGIILIDDDALRDELQRSQNDQSVDRIASAYRTISSKLLAIAQSDGKARTVVLDFYPSPFADVAPKDTPINVDCRLPVIQVALPPPSPFGQEFVRPDPRFIDPASPCSLVAYSFANQAAEGEKLRTVEHDPTPQGIGCPVLSLSSSAVALAASGSHTDSGLGGQPCQRQQALRQRCADLPPCQSALQKRMPLTEPPQNLSVRLANDFFDPAFSEDARQWLTGRVVFIGSSNTQSDDFYHLADGSIGDALGLTAQPSGKTWPGVVVHAGLTQRLLQATASGTEAIRYLDWNLNLVLGVIIAILMAFFDRHDVSRPSARRILLWTTLALAALLALALILASFTALIVNFVLALFGLATAGAIIWLIRGGRRAAITA